MANDFNDLCDIGASYPLATEIGRQMAAGVGNADLLCACGVNAGPAKELANQINTGLFSANQLCAAMWNPTLAIGIAVIGSLLDVFRADTVKLTADTITLTADYAR